MVQARVTLTHKVTVIVQAEDLSQITDWANEHTPEEAYEDARKNGMWPSEDYDELIEPVRYTDDPDDEVDIKLS